MSPVPQLAVIGAGQLGSRHLQALARLDRGAVVYVVDPFPASLERAKSRFEEVAAADSQVELRLSERLDDLPHALDAVIVATSADHRADVVRELLTRSAVRFLILEKVLFQRAADYAEIGERLATAQTPAWVNCPRRLLTGYQTLRNLLQHDGPLHYRLRGSGWGLGCNGIHFFDHAAFLAGRVDLELTAVDLQPGVIPSKRPGFIEVLGQLTGRFGDGSTVALDCPTETPEPLGIDIETATRRIAIREDRGEIVITALQANEPVRTESLVAPPQSQMSQHLVQELLDRGTCPLTPYAESCRLHRPFLAALLDHYRHHVDSGAVACPIT